MDFLVFEKGDKLFDIGFGYGIMILYGKNINQQTIFYQQQSAVGKWVSD